MKKNERGRQLRRPFLSDKVTVLPRNRRLSNAAVKCFFVQNDTSESPARCRAFAFVRRPGLFSTDLTL